MPQKHVSTPTDQPAYRDYQDLFVNAPIGVFSTTPEGRFVDANLTLARMTGYETVEELFDSVVDIGTQLYADPKDRKEIVRLLREREEVVNHECRFVRKDGSIRWWSLSVRPIRGEEGDVLRYQGFISDITERKEAEEALQQQAAEVATVNALARAIHSTGSLGETVHTALEGIFNAVRPDLVFLFLREGERLTFRDVLPSSGHLPLGDMGNHRVGQCICGLSVQEGRPLYSLDIHRDSRCTWNECKQAGIRSLAALPLFRGDEVIGIIGLASDRERDFEGQSGFLETMSSQVSVALGNARLYDALLEELRERKEAEERQALYARLLNILNRPNAWEDLLADLLLGIKEFTGFDSIGIRLREGVDYPYCVQNGFTTEFIRLENHLACMKDGVIARDEHGQPALECTCGLVLSGRAPDDHPLFTAQGSFWCNDTTPLLDLPSHEDPRRNARNRCIHEGYRSVAVIPVRSGGEIIGLLQLNDRRTDRFTPHLIRFFEDIGNSIGIAFVRTRTEQALRELSERQESILMTVPDIIMEVDVNKVYVWANEAGLRFFGDDVIGREASEYFEGEQDTYEQVEPLFHGDENVIYVESWQRRKDGAVRLLAWWCRVLRDAEGETTGALSTARDITGQKKAEETLKSFKEALEFSTDAIGMSTPQGHHYYQNRAFDELFGNVGGYPPDTLYVDRGVGEEVFRTIISGGQWSGEVKMHAKDRQILDILLRAYATEDGDGKIVSLVGIHTDITSRKRAENALKESEQWLASIIEFLPDATLVINRNGEVTAWNRSMEHMTGIRKEEMLGKGDYEYAIPFYGERRPILIDLAILTNLEDERHYTGVRRSGDILYGEAFVPNLPGGSVYLSGTASVLRDSQGEVVGAIECLRDLTYNKRAEEALRESEERFATVFRSSPAPLAIADIDTGAIIDVNDAWVKMVGYGRDETMGQTSRGLGIWENPEDRHILGLKLRDQGFLKEEPINLITRSGEQRKALWSVEKITLGGREAMLSLLYDDTERARSEQEQAKLQEQLYHAQKMESVGMLAGGIAHDFNNVLSSIFGYAELAMMKMSPDDPIFSSLKQIHKAAERSADMTRQLLAFARKQAIAPKVLDLNETVEGMLSMLRRMIGEDIDLAWLPTSGLWAVKADPSQLDQVMANLCVNARDAIVGVGTISIETDNVVVDVDSGDWNAYFNPGEYVMIAVSDSGSGMDKETVAKIFDPFFTTKEVGKGTGLGLATVYGIIKQNSGFINVYSKPGEGTTFRMYLPRYHGATEEAPAEIHKQRYKEGKETILLVEDEAMTLSAASVMLELLGYTVLAAATPGEAIKMAQDHADHIDLLVTDVVMPKMNGRELAETLLAQYPHMRHLFMSGYTADIIHRHGILEEDIPFIAKPFTVNDLADKIREVLDKG